MSNAFKAADTGGDLGFTSKLWQAADKMRNNMDAAEYKHVALGLIFLKYIEGSFTELYDKLINEGEDAEDLDEYKSKIFKRYGKRRRSIGKKSRS